MTIELPHFFHMKGPFTYGLVISIAQKDTHKRDSPMQVTRRNQYYFSYTKNLKEVHLASQMPHNYNWTYQAPDKHRRLARHQQQQPV